MEQVPQRTYVHRSSNSGAGPLIAGLVGGLVIGSALANSGTSVHASWSSGASYWDPYCETRYVSLDRYHSHLRGCGHPHVVRVMRANRFERDLCYRNGSWAEFRGDWRSYGGRSYGGQRGGYVGTSHPAHRWNGGRFYCGGRGHDGHWRSADRCEDEYGRKKVDMVGRRWKNDGDRSWDGDRRWRDRGDDEGWRGRGDDDPRWRDRGDDEDDDDDRWRDRDDEDWDR